MASLVSKDSLNTIAENYHLNSSADGKKHDEMFHQYCYQWVEKESAGSDRVLEMGFGEGNFTERLIASGRQVDIVEGSELLANEARRRFGSKVQVHHALFSDYAPQEKYDTIIATNILEHVEDPVDVLKCTNAWLNPGGKVLVTVPNAESIHRRLAVIMKLQPELKTLSERDKVVGHLRVYDMDTLRVDVVEAGFMISSIAGFVLKILPYSMMKDFSDDLLNAFHSISTDLDPRLMANIGAVLKAK